MKKCWKCRFGFHNWVECGPQNILNVLGRYCSRCGDVQDLMLAAGGWMTVGRIVDLPTTKEGDHDG